MDSRVSRESDEDSLCSDGAVNFCIDRRRELRSCEEIDCDESYLLDHYVDIYLSSPFFESCEQLVKEFIPPFECFTEVKYRGIDDSDGGRVCYVERRNERRQEGLEQFQKQGLHSVKKLIRIGQIKNALVCDLQQPVERLVADARSHVNDAPQI